MTASPHPIVWLQCAGHRVGLVPSLGGSIAAWQIDGAEDPVDLSRPWDGRTTDLYTLTLCPMVPWSNRISRGGFTHDGQFRSRTATASLTLSTATFYSRLTSEKSWPRESSSIPGMARRPSAQ